MPAFPKPRFAFDYHPTEEIENLRRYRDQRPGRAIPARRPGNLLIGSWNIANLGQQRRRIRDYRLLAEVIGWFDLVAVQETKDDLSGLRRILEHLPPDWRALFSDRGGNDERMAFLFDPARVRLLEKVGEVAVPPKDHHHIRLPGVSRKFRGFDRNPYLAAFRSGDFTFVLVNVHLFFGSERKTDRDRRALEAYATARWADLRGRDKDAYTKDIIALGDFNMPRVEPGDPIYSALRRRGLETPPHSSRIGSSIAQDKHYDQIMFLPRNTGREFTGNIGVFDFDGAVFPRLWQARTPAQFRAYVRYFLSDHRPVWAEFRTTARRQ